LSIVTIFVHGSQFEELMSVVLVVIIAVAWLIILGPNLLRRRTRAAGGINSISHFHRSLRILEHSSPPPIVAPAYRLRSVAGVGSAARGDRSPDAAATPVLTVVGADRLPRPALAFLGEDPAPNPNGPEAHRAGSLELAPPTGHHEATGRLLVPDAALRHQVRRRRRDALGILVMVFMVTLMVGFVPGAGVVWVFSMISGLALTGYVALLVRLRQRADERDRKLHYLSPAMARGALAAPGFPSGLTMGVGMPVYMSGRYAHPSNQAAAH
jgi:hypothetical protein